MKTQGEIESEISECMGHFQQEYMGRGPKDIRVYLIGDLIVVRLKGVLTAAEQHLVQTLSSEKGRDLLKQARNHLVEIARPTIDAMIKGITGVSVVSLHHDISTSTGEEVVLFTLTETPVFQRKQKTWFYRSASCGWIHKYIKAQSGTRITCTSMMFLAWLP